MINSKILNRLDLSDDFWQQFNVQNKKLKKQVGLFEVENINRANIVTIALNPKEYYEEFDNCTSNKKHKGLKKGTPGMNFEAYCGRLANLYEYCDKFFRKPKKIEQKRFQIINESMQMKGVSSIQFGQLNDKRFYFCNGIISLPYGHPALENIRQEKHKYRVIHKVIQDKKWDFLKEEAKVLRNIPRLNILNQVFQQTPKLYLLNSTTDFDKNQIQKSTKEYIKGNYW